MVAEVAETDEYQIRPSFEEKFQKQRIEEELAGLLAQSLEGKNYDAESALETTETLTETIREKVCNMGMSQRFKFVVDVKFGEKLGQV